jgi:hypothetical protein
MRHCESIPEPSAVDIGFSLFALDSPALLHEAIRAETICFGEGQVGATQTARRHRRQDFAISQQSDEIRPRSKQPPPFGPSSESLEGRFAATPTDRVEELEARLDRILGMPHGAHETQNPPQPKRVSRRGRRDIEGPIHAERRNQGRGHREGRHGILLGLSHDRKHRPASAGGPNHNLRIF